jgi:hypothetical protein
MKSAVSLHGCNVPLIGSRVLLAVAIGVYVFGISFGHAQIPPSGSVIVNSKVVCHTQQQKGTTPIPAAGVIEFTDQCQLNIPAVDWGAWGKTDYSASSTTNFKFVGSGVPEMGKAIGIFEGRAASSMNGWNKNLANATATMSLRYYFNILRVGNPPSSMVTVPILLTFSGAGKVDKGYATVGLSVFVSGVPGTGFPTKDFQMSWKGGPNSVSLNRSVTLNLPVNKPETPYHVLVAGNAVTSSPTVFTQKINNDVSTASVSVYGTFLRSLSEYYKLEFSPNVIVSRL